jgi:hypothetical protein
MTQAAQDWTEWYARTADKLRQGLKPIVMAAKEETPKCTCYRDPKECKKHYPDEAEAAQPEHYAYIYGGNPYGTPPYVSKTGTVRMEYYPTPGAWAKLQESFRDQHPVTIHHKCLKT